jgi:hypothetical protein
MNNGHEIINFDVVIIGLLTRGRQSKCRFDVKFMLIQMNNGHEMKTINEVTVNDSRCSRRSKHQICDIIGSTSV